MPFVIMRAVFRVDEKGLRGCRMLGENYVLVSLLAHVLWRSELKLDISYLACRPEARQQS